MPHRRAESGRSEALRTLALRTLAYGSPWLAAVVSVAIAAWVEFVDADDDIILLAGFANVLFASIGSAVGVVLQRGSAWQRVIGALIFAAASAALYAILFVSGVVTVEGLMR